MTRYRDRLPQLSGDFFLTDAGMETDLIFNHGINIREFAAHTLLTEVAGREAMARYFRHFLSLDLETQAGFILDSQTWKAHMHWAEDLGATEDELRHSNQNSVEFIAGLRDEFEKNTKPIVVVLAADDNHRLATEVERHVITRSRNLVEVAGEAPLL